MNRIRLPFIENISSIASGEADKIYYIDDIDGSLYKLNINDKSKIKIVNNLDFDEFRNVTALNVIEHDFFCASSNILCKYKIQSGRTYIDAKHVLNNTKNITGITYKNSLFYIADNEGIIAVYDKTWNLIETWNVGEKIDDITIHRHKNTNCLFILDSMSRAVYVYNLYGKHLFSITVPHEDASSITSVYSSNTNNYELYVSYVRKTWEIFDDTDPERCTGNYINIQMHKNAYNVFIEPLNYKLIYKAANNAVCISNGYQISFTYHGMLYPKTAVLDRIKNIKSTARMSIPTNSLRQEVISIETIGQIPGEIKKDEKGRDIIDFDFSKVSLNKENIIFGYKAVFNAYNIRYSIKSTSFPKEFDDNIKEFLREEKKYDMHRRKLQDTARNILSDLPDKKRSNILEVAKSIREYVYNKLEYKYNNRYTSPIETLEDGEGTCGKYTELLIGLMRLCNIPCRAVGDYKVPDYKLEWGISNTYTQPDYDHVWIEFYIPDIGWVPMESSSDDLPGKHDRFFGALPWIHIENSRTEKSKEIIRNNSNSWEPLDKKINFSDLFVHDISIEVIDSI